MELRYGVYPGIDLFLWFPDDLAGVNPAHAKRAGGYAGGEDGEIDSVGRRENRGEAGNGIVWIQ